MSFINNPDITKEEVLKESLAHWNVGKTQEWIDRESFLIYILMEELIIWDTETQRL